MYHVIIFVVALLMAVAPPARTKSEHEILKIIKNIKLADLAKCAPPRSKDDDISKLNSTYYVYHRNGGAICCQIYTFGSQPPTTSFRKTNLETGNATRIFKYACSDDQSLSQYTTVQQRVAQELELAIGKNQIILVSQDGLYVYIFTVVKTYEDYKCIFAQNCHFGVDDSSLVFEVTNYYAMCDTNDSTFDFNVTGLNKEYGITLIAAKNPSACTLPNQ